MLAEGQRGTKKKLKKVPYIWLCGFQDYNVSKCQFLGFSLSFKVMTYSCFSTKFDYTQIGVKFCMERPCIVKAYYKTGWPNLH